MGKRKVKEDSREELISLSLSLLLLYFIRFSHSPWYLVGFSTGTHIQLEYLDRSIGQGKENETSLKSTQFEKNDEALVRNG